MGRRQPPGGTSRTGRPFARATAAGRHRGGPLVESLESVRAYGSIQSFDRLGHLFDHLCDHASRGLDGVNLTDDLADEGAEQLGCSRAFLVGDAVDAPARAV